MAELIGFSVLFSLLPLAFVSVASCICVQILKRYRPNMEDRDVVNWSAGPLPLFCILLLVIEFSVPLDVDENPQGRVIIGVVLILIGTVGWWLGWLSANVLVKRKSSS
ncbi:hypothetical protein OOT33_05010 [Sphingobium sp. DEHP117]|uniref:hypothetical protein n=1 Tax=Sphingobium sp. DEHP117 TaxID=2993436 RepID=UPI0027D61F39|nr:hypothetical protein [Sphingobium sp. DEHP117]MDQ4419800.1 hypothetical protein [Sphingobium sp. DEHP117]